ncbi:MAG TPA: AAC(3) family N-acetyltransferase [Trebonia sp.]|nr:AAC(3) family N-acetyltransferase [Trebonia sp.]
MSDHEAGRSSSDIAGDLRALGLGADRVVLLNASLRMMGPVAGGAATVVHAVRDVLGPAGTLVTPATTAENSDTSRAYLTSVAGLSPAQIRAHRDGMPPFDRATTPATGAGRIAEEIRTTPGAIRSAHPQSSFAAVGLRARPLMRKHRIDCHLGEDSPLGKLYEAGAWVLLLGVGFSSCTALHLAEYRYLPAPPRRAYRCVVRHRGQRQWRTYRDVVLDDSDFEVIGEVLDKNVDMHRGYIGNAESRLMPMRPLVDFVTNWMREHRR